MNVEAPQLSALITILRSVGPVISTRRSRRSFGCAAIVHSDSRIARVSGRKSGQPARVEFLLPFAAALQKLAAPRVEFAMQQRYESKRLGRQDLGKRLRDGRIDPHARRADEMRGEATTSELLIAPQNESSI
jgi:hypothetical protein